MNEIRKRHENTLKPVVYRLPNMDGVTIRRDVGYRNVDDSVSTLDIYYPLAAANTVRLPAVVFATGYPDPGFETFTGCKLKEMESYICWAKLVAASGMVAITYANREPTADLHAVLHYVRSEADALGVDVDKIAIWSTSGNVPTALTALMHDSAVPIKCAVLSNGYLLDLDGHGNGGVAQAQQMFRFNNPCTGKSVDDLASNVPLLLVRSGKDQMPHLNDSIDRFVAKALQRNLPITLVNHAAAPHSFELDHDSETSREIIRQVLAFLRFHSAS